MVSHVVINGWKSNIRFSSAHIIPEYKKCGRLHGHTYAVHVKVFGKPDENGIIIDFSILKDILREIVNKLDHKILIPEKNCNVIITKNKESIRLRSNGKFYVFPVHDCYLLPISSTSAEKLSQYILNSILEKVNFSNRIKSIEIGVDEGYGQGARMKKVLER